MVDNVNHPQHYAKHKITLEPIDIIGGVEFCISNVIKYVTRACDKGHYLEDLQKARVYYTKSLMFWSPRADCYVSRFAVLHGSDNYMLSRLGQDLMSGKDPRQAWSSLGMMLNEWINDEEKEEENAKGTLE